MADDLHDELNEINDKEICQITENIEEIESRYFKIKDTIYLV